MQTSNVGIAGEFRCVVTKVDGTIKEYTGFQKNLILNQGLDFFGGGKGTYINESCAIGSGNRPPAVTQTKLDAYVAQASGTDITSDYSYVDKGDGLYRMWEQKKYRFTGLDSVNISEVGLVSEGRSPTDYHLTTRALIKDGLGAPTSISVKTGETLDIYYKIHKVIDTRDKAFVINVSDGNSGSVPYNVVIRAMDVGTTRNNVSSAISTGTIRTSNKELVAITAFSDGDTELPSKMLSVYTQGAFKISLTLGFSLSVSNKAIRKLDTQDASKFTFLPFQMRLGRVSDDAPLTKTDKDTLTIPLEFSWGRYEGVL